MYRIVLTAPFFLHVFFFSIQTRSSTLKSAMQSKKDLLTWLNQILDCPITKIEELGKGIHYNLLFYNLDRQYPLRLMNKNAKTESEYLKNLKICQDYMTKQNIVAYFPLTKICKCKLQDNLEFIQWFYKFNEARINLKENDNNESKKDLSAVKPNKNTCDIKRVSQNSSSVNYNRKTSNYSNIESHNSSTTKPYDSTNKSIAKEPLNSSNHKPHIMMNMEKKIDREKRLSKENTQRIASSLIDTSLCKNEREEISNASSFEIVNEAKNSVKFENTKNLSKIENSTLNSFYNLKISNQKECLSCKTLNEKIKDYKMKEYYLEEKVKYYDKKMMDLQNLENDLSVLEKKCIFYENLLNETKNEHNNKIEVLSNYIEKFQIERDFYFGKIKEIENEIRNEKLCKTKLLEILYNK